MIPGTLANRCVSVWDTYRVVQQINLELMGDYRQHARCAGQIGGP